MISIIDLDVRFISFLKSEGGAGLQIIKRVVTYTFNQELPIYIRDIWRPSSYRGYTLARGTRGVPLNNLL
jgi:hypothetical protein